MTGVDAKALAMRIKSASPNDRSELIQRYIAWIREGARAQGGYRWGLIPFFFGVLALYFAVVGMGQAWVALGAIGVAFGAWLTRIAWRRERDWRRTHPFQM